MGYELSYIVESKENIQILWDTDNYQKTYNQISLFHTYEDMPFELSQYDFSVGTRAWNPMLLLLNNIINSTLTERLIKDESWRTESSHSPKMMRLNNGEVNELWNEMRKISIIEIEKEASKNSQIIKQDKNNYHNWKIDRIDYIEREYIELFKAIFEAHFNKYELLLTIE